jgi:hypothetical protein
MKGGRDEARIIIARLPAKPEDDPQVVDDLSIICDSVARAEEQGNFGWREVFRNDKKQTFRRILLGARPSFMQRTGGTNVVAYSLPVVPFRSFGFTDRLALILSACDSISLMFWGSMTTFLIDRVGRKNLMLMGALYNRFVSAWPEWNWVSTLIGGSYWQSPLFFYTMSSM